MRKVNDFIYVFLHIVGLLVFTFGSGYLIFEIIWPAVH